MVFAVEYHFLKLPASLLYAGYAFLAIGFKAVGSRRNKGRKDRYQSRYWELTTS